MKSIKRLFAFVAVLTLSLATVIAQPGGGMGGGMGGRSQQE